MSIRFWYTDQYSGTGQNCLQLYLIRIISIQSFWNLKHLFVIGSKIMYNFCICESNTLPRRGEIPSPEKKILKNVIFSMRMKVSKHWIFTAFMCCALVSYSYWSNLVASSGIWGHKLSMMSHLVSKMQQKTDPKLKEK